GFEAGLVTDITFNEEKQTVTAHINIDPRAEFILREGTRFWVVEPEISIHRVRNLETLLTGVYIAFEPGDGIFKDYFNVQKAPLADKIMPAGKIFNFVTNDSDAITIAAPVLYRKLKIGEISDFQLKADGSHIRGQILIYEKYDHLVKSNSVFWKVGGLKIKADFDGIDIETGTLDTLLAGGITFTNPVDDNPAGVASKLQNFTIYASREDAARQVPVLRKQGINIHLRAGNAKDFSIGSPVLYKYIKVGKVTGFSLAEDGEGVIIDLFISRKYAHLLRESSLFYNISNLSVEGDLSGIKIKTGSLKSMLAGGIAFFTPITDKIETSKIISGQQYILYESHSEALDVDKKLISIKFSDPEGLKPGLYVRYHGIVIGNIEEVAFNTTMDTLICQVLIDKEAAKLFTSDAKIWLVRPEISLAGINNLDTVVSGSYITLCPGNGDPVDTFTALSQPPVFDIAKTGLNIILEARRLGSLKKGSPIYYRQIKIGRVTG
ncbi:MAG: MCE family protein, partial [Deltaproteobacteria bacterium]|nr:MCE family protein [Deltaproteobacteria bacterium]